MIGVVDESGILEPNEVYVAIRKDSFNMKSESDANTNDAEP